MRKSSFLMLAGLAAISLGVGAANAQSLTPSSAEGAYWAAQSRITSDRAISQDQAGSSDVEQRPSGANHSATFIQEHHLYGAAGVAG